MARGTAGGHAMAQGTRIFPLSNIINKDAPIWITLNTTLSLGKCIPLLASLGPDHSKTQWITLDHPGSLIKYTRITLLHKASQGPQEPISIENPSKTWAPARFQKKKFTFTWALAR